MERFPCGVWLWICVSLMLGSFHDAGSQRIKDSQLSFTPSLQKCQVLDFERIPCGEPSISSTDCEAMNCCFDQQQCFYGRTVTVHCTRDGQFVAVVARDATLPQLSLESVSLLENQGASCGPVSSSTTFAVFLFPVNTCGTVVKEEGDYLVYENKIISSYEVGMGPLGSITRDTVFELFFQCRYSASGLLAVLADVGTLASPPGVASPGPLRVELRLAKGQCLAKGCTEVNAYESYYTDAEYPVTKVLREPVYVEVRLLERTDPNLVLTLQHCWATATPNSLSLPQWSLLVDGCPYQDDRYLTTLVPVDGSSGLPNPTHYKRFIIQMFTFVDADMVPLTESVYIHCSTAVCYPSATDSCEHRCHRQRRNAAEGNTREVAVVSSGKVIIADPELSASSMSHSDEACLYQSGAGGWSCWHLYFTVTVEQEENIGSLATPSQV
ncbi:zona pellucida sperm-binding protein 4-like [Megalops cyprinoides]|uniref:zona pellucida sperm-binding protein 4-like n=1 Tax=Megalops cyprinoides TaxID=118141 RepID=UPI001864D7B7|nr:zona pellucida sperm-binding protein 4-like [Megalops cyprinoides]